MQPRQPHHKHQLHHTNIRTSNHPIIMLHVPHISIVSQLIVYQRQQIIQILFISTGYVEDLVHRLEKVLVVVRETQRFGFV